MQGDEWCLMQRLSRDKSRSLLLIELADERGHSNGELKNILKYKTKVSGLLRELEGQGIVYRMPAESTNLDPKHDRRKDLNITTI
jgi:DNA-binding MarR family transcriptional regulator